jgi:AcrR family transcriptional regulator
MADIPRPRRTRADAVRNREQILRAAADLLAEVGMTVALETIARRAGVGIATLYRHFPDRSVLLRQVAVDMLRQSAATATTALAEEPDAFSALIRYLHAAIDLRMDVIMPMLAERVAGDEELFAARAESKRALETLVQAAHDEESLRPDVGPGDITLLVMRVARPLPVPIVQEANRRLSHRHAEIIIDGLVRFLATDSLQDRPPLRTTELTPVPIDGDEPVWVDPNGYWTGVKSAADNEDRSTKTCS